MTSGAAGAQSKRCQPSSPTPAHWERQTEGQGQGEKQHGSQGQWQERLWKRSGPQRSRKKHASQRQRSDVELERKRQRRNLWRQRQRQRQRKTRVEVSARNFYINFFASLSIYDIAQLFDFNTLLDAVYVCDKNKAIKPHMGHACARWPCQRPLLRSTSRRCKEEGSAPEPACAKKGTAKRRHADIAVDLLSFDDSSDQDWAQQPVAQQRAGGEAVAGDLRNIFPNHSKGKSRKSHADKCQQMQSNVEAMRINAKQCQSM